MQTIEPIIIIIHFIVCIFLIIFILLQAGKGADMGAAFGAGSSQTLFGARGATTFLAKLTTVGAVVFLLTSISLATISRNRSGNTTESVIEKVEKSIKSEPVEKTEPPTHQEAPAPEAQGE